MGGHSGNLSCTCGKLGEQHDILAVLHATAQAACTTWFANPLVCATASHSSATLMRSAEAGLQKLDARGSGQHLELGRRNRRRVRRRTVGIVAVMNGQVHGVVDRRRNWMRRRRQQDGNDLMTSVPSNTGGRGCVMQAMWNNLSRHDTTGTSSGAVGVFNQPERGRIRVKVCISNITAGSASSGKTSTESLGTLGRLGRELPAPLPPVRRGTKPAAEA